MQPARAAIIKPIYKQINNIAMNFKKIDIENALDWYSPEEEEHAISECLKQYYSRYYPHVVGDSEDEYKYSRELYGVTSITDICEETELSTVIEYKGSEFKITVKSLIDVNLCGADAADYLYLIEVKEL